jgi:tetratricopeptide (TPR) repeat protein
MTQKSLQKADEFRLKGNYFYAKQKYFEALASYNKSLCYAPLGSEKAALVYANRSAVYLENKLYEKCLANIKRAELLNYPKPEILQKRRERCHEMMSENEDPRFKRHKFELSYPPHKNFPFMVEYLELRKDENGIPHVYATRDLHVGDIVAFAEPVAPRLKENNIGLRCSFCLKDNLFDLYPCPTCTEGKLKYFS